jgi:Nif-specific regulatory protein
MHQLELHSHAIDNSRGSSTNLVNTHFGIYMRDLDSTGCEQLQIKRLEHENRELRKMLLNQRRPQYIVGNSSTMNDVYSFVKSQEMSLDHVMVRGERGCGKSLLARTLHSNSILCEKPFLHIHCTSINSLKKENELFGLLVKQTSKNVKPKGLENAYYLTLYLDKVESLCMRAQKKLLKALVNNETKRVRIIASSSVSLEKYVERGLFDEDLYFALRLSTIALPPLRARGADILLLAEHFLRKYSVIHKKEINRFTIAAVKYLTSYRWPGNVRELESAIETAVYKSENGVISDSNLSSSIRSKPQIHTMQVIDNLFKERVELFEKDLIIEALGKTRGNQSEAGLLLRISLRMLNYKIMKYKIDCSVFR